MEFYKWLLHVNNCPSGKPPAIINNLKLKIKKKMLQARNANGATNKSKDLKAEITVQWPQGRNPSHNPYRSSFLQYGGQRISKSLSAAD
jgi:hypothetical protein